MYYVHDNEEECLCILYVVNTMAILKEKAPWTSNVSMNLNSKDGSNIVYVGINLGL
jgi:hypothetical protein